jgi:hypothetical protein
LKTPDPSENPTLGTTADVRTSSVWFAGIVGALLVVIVVLAVSVLVFQRLNAEAATEAAEPVPELQALWAAQRAKLEGRGPGKPGLSIERAMQLVTQDISLQPPEGSPHAK